LKRLESFARFSSQFWILCFVTFLGNTSMWLFLPFILIYINTSLGISVAIGGLVLAVNTVLRMASLAVAGELSDRLGRRTLLLLSLLTRMIIFAGLFLVKDVLSFMVLYCLMGIFISLGDPARDAMVADIVPEARRVEAYSIMRVAINGALIAGSTAGGIIAARNLPAVFAGAALLCGVTSLLVFKGLEETYSRKAAAQSFVTVLGDRKLLTVCFLMVVIGFMLGNLSIILPIYGKLVLELTESHIGTFLALNGIMVVIFQYPVSRVSQKMGSTSSLVAGCLFFTGGLLGMIGVVAYVHVLIAVALVTLGELLIIPTTTAMVSGLAPQEFRGSYMGLYNLSVYAGFALDSLVGGYVFDINVKAVWYISGILGVVALAGFYFFEKMRRSLSEQ